MPVAYDDNIPDTFIEGTPAPDITSGAGMTVAGANRFVLASLGTFNGATTHTGTKIGGSGGVDLTQIGTTSNLGTANCNHSTYGLAAPALGATTMYGDWAGDQERVSLLAASFTGVDQAVPTAALEEANGFTDTSVTVTSTLATAPGDMAFVAISAFGNAALAPSGSETDAITLGSITNAQTAGCEHIALARPASGGSTTDISVVFTASVDVFYSRKAFVIKAAPAAGSKQLLTLGVC